MAELIANSEIVQSTRTAMGCSISKPFSSLAVFLELIIKERAKSIHWFFVLIISCFLVEIDSFLEIFFYFNTILVEICNFIESFVAWLRRILLLSKTHSFSIEFHCYLYMIRDILMLFIFITETHLVQCIGQIVSRSSFIIFKGHVRIWFDICHSDLINSAESHHSFRITQISTFSIQINSLLNTLWIILAYKKQGVSFKTIVLCLNEVIIADIHSIIPFNYCYLSLCFDLSIGIWLIPPFTGWIILYPWLYRVSLFYIQSCLSLGIVSCVSGCPESFVFF